MLAKLTVTTVAIVAVLGLSACSDRPGDVVAPSAADGVKERGLVTGGPDQAFLASLDAAFDATEWELVNFGEVTRGGTQVAFPKSFAKGQYLQVSVAINKDGPREVPGVQVYVPTELGATPGRCVLFRFNGLVDEAEYVIETFLPAWFDELDLGTYHHTYQLNTAPDGQTYVADWLTRFDTPPTPWASPPVVFSVLQDDPTSGNKDKWVLDPEGAGTD